MENQKIGILGAGSMGGAILTGLIKAGVNPKNIAVSTKTSATGTNLSEQLGIISYSQEKGDDANHKVASFSQLLILALKPNLVLEVLQQVAGSLPSGSLVVSVAAGVTTSSIEQIVGDKAGVVRAMPNTPSIFGLGVTGISTGSSASAQQLDLAKQLFGTIGQVIELPEEQINALSTISGSGPAYVFYFAEKMIAAAEEMGFSKAQAELMVKGTFLGSAKLLSESTLSPAQLREQVTSPGGTTVEAIARFDQADIEKVFKAATRAALERAIELGRLNS